jgi:hypothetical protein
MHQIPIIRDTDSELSSDSCPCRGDRLKELHNIHRTLPDRVIDSYSEDFLQTEDLFPVLDEIENLGIFDNLKV